MTKLLPMFLLIFLGSCYTNNNKRIRKIYGLPFGVVKTLLVDILI